MFLLILFCYLLRISPFKWSISLNHVWKLLNKYGSVKREWFINIQVTFLFCFSIALMASNNLAASPIFSSLFLFNQFPLATNSEIDFRSLFVFQHSLSFQQILFQVSQICLIIAVYVAEHHVILHSQFSIAHFALFVFLPCHLSLFEFYNFDVLFKIIGLALLSREW